MPTTTLPEACTLIARGPTFDSLECRLDDLDSALNALGASTPKAPVARDRLGRAVALEQRARTTCQAGDAKRARKQLKATFRKLGRVRALLNSKSGRKIPGRDALAAELDGIRIDVRSLRGVVSCPVDAAPTLP